MIRPQSPASMVASSPPAARDHGAERTWLIAAERAAGAGHFTTHALRRLDAGQAAYGDRWATLGLHRLVHELLEEAADLGAWGVLALEALERDAASLSDTQRRRLEGLLHAAIVAGARAHRELERALGFRPDGSGDAA